VDAAPPDADPQRDRPREDDGGGHAGDQADDASAADDEAPERGHDGAADGGAEPSGDGGSAPAEGGDAAPSTDVGGDGVPSSGDGPPAADPEPLDTEP
jgi:hypothetical protein